MARARTTDDVFNAIAEPKRRLIIELLARRGAMAVGAIVLALGMTQPAVSKHLGVLREVGVVSVTRQGQHRMYELEADKLKTVHDWVKAFEQFWTRHLDRIKVRAERAMRERAASSRQSQPKKGSS